MLRFAHLAAACLVMAAPALVAQEPDFTLEGLVVTVTPVPRALDAVASHVTVLDGEELREQGVTRVVDALRHLAGVHVARSGSFGGLTSVFFRGGESDYVQVLVDGVQVNQPGGGFDFATLSTDNVERIEVVRGPNSALHGSDAVAGVVHVITRSGRDGPRGSLNVEAGSFGRLEAVVDLSGGSELVGYGFSATRRATDGILALNNDFDDATLSGSVRVSAEGGTSARLSVRYTDREYHFPTDGSGNVVDRNSFQFADQLALSLEASRHVGERVELRVLLTTHDFNGGTDDAPDDAADSLGFYSFQSLDDVRRTTADVRVNVRLDPATVLTAGAELEEQRQRSLNESLSEFGPNTGRSVDERSNRAAYLHGVAGSGPVSGHAGLRLEDNERFGSFLTHQVGVVLDLGRATKVRLSTGRGIKEPTFFENFATGFALGNPALEPERSRSWEVGAEHGWSDRLRFTATWFDQAFSDLVQYTFTPLTPGGANFYNVAEARSRGLELSAVAVAGVVDVRADYTYVDTEVVDSGFDEGEGATFVDGSRLLRRPAHAASVRLGWHPAAAVQVHAAWKLVGPRDDLDFATFPAARVTLERHSTLDAGLAMSLSGLHAALARVRLSLRVENLLDAAYEEVLGFGAPGRGLYVGVSAGFGGG